MREREMRQPRVRVLVVDDEPEIAAMLARALTRHGFSVETSTSSDRALELMRVEPFDAAIVDLVMPERDGIEVAGTLAAQAPGMAIAVCTGYQNSPLIAAAERLRLTVFQKPVEIREIVEFLGAQFSA